MVVDKRATRAIKVCINKLFKNKNSLNLRIAETISEYSHSSILRRGSVFQYDNSAFYMVNKVKSPFWVSITSIPPVRLIMAPWGSLALVPSWRKASAFHVKKVFDPFGMPYLKKRDKKIYLKKPL